jgi:LysM repeat protein
MRKLFFLILPNLLILLTFLGTMPAQAQAGDPYSLVAAVNQLRTANGLPELQINGILMGVSQAHTDYQVSISEVTHYGPGGSRPRDRAAAAGYGNGANFFMSENIAGGTNLSVSEVIVWWQGDDLHLNTMLGANYAEIGAGVAVDGEFVYYTIDTAYVSGGSYSPPTALVSGTPGPTAIPIYYVTVATPNADGSVVHIVQSGQTLIGIAQAYGVTVGEIKALNNMTTDDIYVDDQLLIRPAGTPNPSETPTATVTATHLATATRFPTRTPTASQPAAEISATALPTATPTQAGAASDMIGNILVGAIITLGVGGVALMVVGGLLRRRPGGGDHPS